MPYSIQICKINTVKNQNTLKRKGLTLFLSTILTMAGFHAWSEPLNPPPTHESMKVSLFAVPASGAASMVDGNLTNYDDAFDNAAGLDDALKMNNFGENFGITRDGLNLSIEQRKKMTVNDTTFFVMWNMVRQNYTLRLIAKNLNHPGMEGFLEDNFTRVRTSLDLNDTSMVNFTVTTDPGSYAPNRFRIVYVYPPAVALPLVFTDIQLTVNAFSVQVGWKVENENSIQDYTIEHSTDGTNFAALKSVAALNTASIQSYQFKDPTNRTGEHFYRIKAINRSGSVVYSQMAKTVIEIPDAEISVYPNPVVNKTLQISFRSQSQGKYHVQLIASNGTVQTLPSIQVTGMNMIVPVTLPRQTATGIYRIKITLPDNSMIVKTINVL
jgi:hypothetical protein